MEQGLRAWIPEGRFLWLGSRSLSRQQLLREAGIPFRCIDQDADEIVDEALGLEARVAAVARQKMAAVQLPNPRSAARMAHEGYEKIAFIATADTLTASMDGQIYGKPGARERAREILHNHMSGVLVATGVCCERRSWDGETWKSDDLIEIVTTTRVDLAFTELWIERYLDANPLALKIAGGLMVEGFGAQFIARVEGSYTGVMGLPMAELRQSLEQLDFFDMGA